MSRLEETDRLMRDFVSIEEVSHRKREIQNVAVHTYDAAAGQTPDSIIPALIRTYPNVYVIRDLVNQETAKSATQTRVEEDHLVITTVRARDAAEALLRILQLKIPSKDFAELVTAVLYQRLIRTLCPDCKVGYQPSADLLRKLGIPAGKIEQLYRPPKPEEIDKPCPTCDGLGYKGRTGIFELLEVNDTDEKDPGQATEGRSAAQSRQSRPSNGRCKKRESCWWPRARLPCPN